MTQDQHDHRYDVADANRRGAHRARSNPLQSLLPLLAVVVVVAGVVLVAWTLFGRPGSATPATPDSAASAISAGAGGDSSAAYPSSGAASTKAAAASAPASATAAATGSEVGTAAAFTAPTASASGGSPTGVDKSVVLNFYNGSSPQVPGLSRRAAAIMKAAGWSVGSIQTWTGPAVSQNTVYYDSAAHLDTAKAVVQALGGGTVTLNAARAGNGLTVVVGNNYTP